MLKIMEEKENNAVEFGASITNKDLIDLLINFPDDAVVTIECCNPKAMYYNKEDNTIRIN